MSSPRRVYVCGPTCPYDSTVRTSISDRYVAIFGWPSRGGVIILDDAEAMDFKFLGLDPMDPPAQRLDNQDDEDSFCQRLLLTGAKWWDSEARYHIVTFIEEEATGRSADRVDNAFNPAKEPPPTMREKRFVKVGWPSSGGCWVAEFDTTWAGVDEEDNLLPDEGAARIRLAQSMDERCLLLRDRFNATFYHDLKNYKGYTFLNSWDTKETGEVGPLLLPRETARLWSDKLYSLN